MFYYMEMIHKPKDLKYKDWNGNVVFLMKYLSPATLKAEVVGRCNEEITLANMAITWLNYLVGEWYQVVIDSFSD